MSNIKVLDSKLVGFSGPFFPDSLERVQRRYTYHRERINEILFDDIVDRLHEGGLWYAPQTSDVEDIRHSPWCCRHDFTRHGHKFAILLPTVLGKGRTDGSFSTRHVALYAQHGTAEVEIELAASEYAEIFVSTYKTLWGNAIKASKRRKAD